MGVYWPAVVAVAMLPLPVGGFAPPPPVVPWPSAAPDSTALRHLPRLPPDWTGLASYQRQVGALRKLCIYNGTYARPEARRRGSVGALGGLGGFKDARFVRESDDIEAHVHEACGTCFPTHVERGGYVPTADLVAAAEQCAELGERAQGWRRRRVREFQAIVHNLDALESDLRSFVDIPPTVSAVAGGVNVALLFCMVDALYWPDDELPYRMLTGMPVLGAIEDTGLYRPVTPDCTMAEFRASRPSWQRIFGFAWVRVARRRAHSRFTRRAFTN